MMGDVIGSSLESLGSPRAESVRWAQMEPDSDGEKNIKKHIEQRWNIYQYTFISIITYFT